MTTITHLPFGDGDAALLDPEVDGLLLQLRGLVLVRDLLAKRGASHAEAAAHAAEAERVRARLARLIGADRDGAGDPVVAVA